MPPAGGEVRDARRFRVENRRTQADERGRSHHHRVVGGLREKNQTAQGETHPAGERVGLRLPIRVPADERLQDRSGHLKGERDQADLDEAEVKARLEERINRRDKRLDGVVEQMRKTDREENREHRRTGRPATGRGIVSGEDEFRCCATPWRQV